MLYSCTHILARDKNKKTPSKLSKSTLRSRPNDSLGRRVPAGVIEKLFTWIFRIRYLNSTVIPDKIGLKKCLFLRSKGKTVRRRCQNTPKKARQNVSQGSTGPFLGLLPVRTERSKRVIGLKIPKNRSFLALQANYPLNGIHRQLRHYPLNDPQKAKKQGLLGISVLFGVLRSFSHHFQFACRFTR